MNWRRTKVFLKKNDLLIPYHAILLVLALISIQELL